jgi:hypothetical protein
MPKCDVMVGLAEDGWLFTLGWFHTLTKKRNVCQLLKNSKQNAKQKLSNQPKFMIIIFFNRLFEITILTKKNPFKQKLKLIKEGSKLWNSWMDIFIKWSRNKNVENEGGRFFQTEQGIKAEQCMNKIMSS